METRVLSTDPTPLLKSSAREAVALLEAGEVVALPTETVYGLAGRIDSPEAIAKIFEAKERPSFDPLIVHLPRREHLAEVANIPEGVEKTVKQLIENFWPGPLTLVLPKTEAVSDVITAGLPTVAVRMSSDPVFKRVVFELGKPLAAPSANRFGRISPTSAAAVQEELNGRIPMILDGGACWSGVESTIIKLEPATEKIRKTQIHILRAGPVTVEDLKKYGKVFVPKQDTEDADDAKPEAPGQTSSHYAPQTPLRLVMDPSDFTPEPNKRYALLSFRGFEQDGYLDLAEYEQVLILSPGSGKVPEAAVRLFFMMRQLDALGVDEIIAEKVPEHGMGLAIMDRLRRASV